MTLNERETLRVGSLVAIRDHEDDAALTEGHVIAVEGDILKVSWFDGKLGKINRWSSALDGRQGVQ